MEASEKARIKKAKVKLARYCAYRERTHQEVKNKALEVGLRVYEADELLAELISENFLSEERFAKVYVRDKFYLNKWGRNKIRQGLQQKGISPYCIGLGFEEIIEEDYIEMLHNICIKKVEVVKEVDLFLKKRKVATYLIGRGFESDIVWEVVNSICD